MPEEVLEPDGKNFQWFGAKNFSGKKLRLLESFDKIVN